MARKVYSVLNGAAPGAAAPVNITTGTALKTMLQLATNATTPSIDIAEWFVTFDGSVAGTPIKVELLRHQTAPQTTLTAYVAGDITKVSDPNSPASSVQLGTALSGFGTGAAEVVPTGSPVSIETHLVSPTSGFYTQFPLDVRPEVAVNNFLRVRTTAGTAVNCYAGVQWVE